MARPEKHVLLCAQSRDADDPKGSCSARGSAPLIQAFSKEFSDRGLWGKIKFNTTSCLGACEHGPVVLVYPEGVMYGKVQLGDVARIIDEHLVGGKPVEALKVPKDVWD